ncbi:MAG: hypothetical protein GY934_04670 [Gammaproteobacteria bacterium]|nr:hypothetical protein [Gammaproteobacteria bacterium]
MGEAIGAGIEGRITFELFPGTEKTVVIHSSRPLQTPRIFQYKRVDQVMVTLPLLFSICKSAQSVAAVTACEDALGITPLPETAVAREMLVWFETAKEHVWRILIDWAEYLGDEVNTHAVAKMNRLFQSYRSVLDPGDDLLSVGGGGGGVNMDDLQEIHDQFEQLLIGTIFLSPVWKILAMEQDGVAVDMLRKTLQSSWFDQGVSGVKPLPNLSSDFLHTQLSGAHADHFVAQPCLDQTQSETGPYARCYNHPMMVEARRQGANELYLRQAARLVELDSIPQILRNGTAQMGVAKTKIERRRDANGIGMSQLEAARGRLVHRVVVEDGQIASYQILAPTEWNFHPRGFVADGLAAAAASCLSRDDLEAQTRLLVMAIDPCVGYDLVIH